MHTVPARPLRQLHALILAEESRQSLTIYRTVPHPTPAVVRDGASLDLVAGAGQRCVDILSTRESQKASGWTVRVAATDIDTVDEYRRRRVVPDPFGERRGQTGLSKASTQQCAGMLQIRAARHGTQFNEHDSIP
jgi:hypothetical protein